MVASIDKTNTPDEIIDVVNEQDEIIGQTTKGEANNNPRLIHREIAIIIYDSSKKILFQLRSRHKTVDPLAWSLSVAGHIPTGMAIEAAAHQELREELGFDVPLTYLTKILRKYDNETHFVSYFTGLYDGSPIQIEPAEVEEVRFLDEKELNLLIDQNKSVGEHTIEMVRQFWNRQ